MNPTASVPVDMANAGPLVEELPPSLDPMQALRSVTHLPHAVLLDSAMFHPQLGRYSYLAADPFEWLTVGRHANTNATTNQADPLGWLERQLARYSMPCL